MKSEAVRVIQDVCCASVNDGTPEHSRESQRQAALSMLRLEIKVSYIFLLRLVFVLPSNENVSFGHPAKTRMPPANPSFPRVQPA